MEFQIRNSYIKKFLGGFAHQNELKIIKYLTILGIHFLDTNKNFNITFADLKKMASNQLIVIPFLSKPPVENITKSVAKEDKLLNKELIIIKKELVKLSQKFEEKIKYFEVSRYQSLTSFHRESAETEPNEPESEDSPKNKNGTGDQTRSRSVPKTNAAATTTKKSISHRKVV